MFAHDVILFSENRKKLLENIQPLLERFGEISGLHINIDKSEIYPVQLKEETKKALQTQYKYKWTRNSFRYLGVYMPVNVQDLCKENYNRAFTEAKRLLQDWNKLTLSWSDRLNIIKMFIFPKFLFLFRMLPMFIPLKEMKCWQARILKFIWNGKLHRIPFNIMRKHSREGGLGIPDLEKYYQAANLANITLILTQQNEVDWNVIEKEHAYIKTLAERVWQKRKTFKDKETLS